MDDVRGILEEQIAYYRARAAEYDEWWERVGSYDLGEEFLQGWQSAITKLENYVRDHVTGGDVLEIAAGTGNFTGLLADRADSVTAVDSSPETLALNRGKLERAGLADRVELVVADVFDWQPPRRFDVVFFSFWISHVPESAAAAFWATVDAALAPDGLVILTDNLAPWDPAAFAAQGPMQNQRTLNDGSKWTVVKRYWTPPERLRDELSGYGWRAEVGAIDDKFIVATARRAGD